MESIKKPTIGVIGAGASGLFYATRAGALGCDVTLFEKNEKCGRKLSITGKGRCNLTNNCPVNDFIENIVTNKRFMYKAAAALPPSGVMEIFENELGVPLKTERGNRVFPESDKASDIVSALVKRCEQLGVHFIKDKVSGIVEEDGAATGIVCSAKKYTFDVVVVAAGGASYPLTGSDGFGCRLAKSLGIKVTPLQPSLIPLTCRDKSVCELMGLSLKNIRITVTDTESKKTVYSDFGEMIFTHFGFSGPVILSSSAHLRPMIKDKYKLSIDLKPALDEKTLDSRLLSDFSKYKNRDFRNALSDLLPSKLIPVFIKRCGINENEKANSITKEQRRTIISTLKAFDFVIDGTRPISEAIITSGGVDLSEINPSTMECKKIKNMYFIGEVLDLDAYTGGFNLQIAFSTANLAAKDAAKRIIGD